MRSNKILKVSKGDFLLSPRLIPYPDYILFPDRSSGKDEFVVGFLDSYLKFLELVITNERILDITFSTYTEAEAKVVGEEALEFYFDRGIYIKKPILRQQLLKELKAENIYFPVIGQSNYFSPRKIIDVYLSISPQLQNLFKKKKDRTPIEFKKNAELIAQIALAEDIGIPLSIIEYAKRTSLPYALASDETESVKEFESTETNLRNGVIAFLKEKLDRGARKEIARIDELGNKTIYPETPIAWQIVRDSSKLEDFLPVTLQLREEYKKFRETTIKIEEELFSDEITLKRKRQLVRELDFVADAIWKDQENTTRKVAQDFSSILDLALNQATNLSTGNFPKLLEFVLGRPVEILLSKLHERKIKVLLNSKKQFMNGSRWVDKISSIFSLPKHEIKEELTKYRNNTKL